MIIAKPQIIIFFSHKSSTFPFPLLEKCLYCGKPSWLWSCNSLDHLCCVICCVTSASTTFCLWILTLCRSFCKSGSILCVLCTYSPLFQNILLLGCSCIILYTSVQMSSPWTQSPSHIVFLNYQLTYFSHGFHHNFKRLS